MIFKKTYVWLLTFFIGCCPFVSALNCDSPSSNGQLYLRLGTGFSFSQKAQIHAPFPFWDKAIEGYNSDLGSAPIITVGVGYDFGKYFSTDITFAYRAGYKYRKFQTSVFDPSTIFFLGTKTRKFNLDVLTAMWNLYLDGRGWNYLTWNCLSGTFYPVVGGGIGISRLNIFNFRSTGVTGLYGNENTFGSENEYTVRYHLTYQLLAALEFRYCDDWSLAVGYRWFDAGKFKGPAYFRIPDGTAVQATGNDKWDIRLRAHEFLVEVKFFL